MKLTSLLIGIIFLSLISQGQTTTQSPYSYYGLGDVNNRSFANQRSLGGAHSAASSPIMINTLNPATFGSLTYTTFAIDINLDFRSIASSTVTQPTNNTYFNNLAIAFPLGKRGGMAASLRQYTKMGYNIEIQQEDPNIGEYQFIYDGQGGINEFLFGFGYNVYQDTNTTIALGANFLYYFGFAETNRRTDNFDSDANALSSNIQRKTSINDVSFDMGLYIDHRFSRNLKIGLGGSYTPSRKLNAKQNSLTYTYRTVLGDEIPKDSTQVFDTKGKIAMPSSLNIGFAFYLGNSWKVFADYKTQKWSELEIFDNPQNLNDRVEYSVGIQNQPNADALAKYIQSVNYRVGFKYADTRLKVYGKDLTEYAVTAGLGLPIMKTKSKSSINLGIEFGTRGEKGTNLVEETFTNIFLGVSFNPHKFDTWFKKSKYN